MMSGQTSQVWEVVEAASHRHFAMKLLLPEKAKDSEARCLLFHEAEVGKKLAHPNVIRITELSRDPKVPYFVMEFFPAGSLKLRLARKDFAFIKERAHSIFKQAATGFAYMSPAAGCIATSSPTTFWSATPAKFASSTWPWLRRSKRPASSADSFADAQGPGHAQLHVARADSQRTARSAADIYSFGATAYELVAQRPPFRGGTEQDLLQKQIIEKPSTPQIYNPDVTDEFAALILRMLAKKKEDRPKDFHEILIAHAE